MTGSQDSPPVLGHFHLPVRCQSAGLLLLLSATHTFLYKYIFPFWNATCFSASSIYRAFIMSTFRFWPNENKFKWFIYEHLIYLIFSICFFPQPIWTFSPVVLPYCCPAVLSYCSVDLGSPPRTWKLYCICSDSISVALFDVPRNLFYAECLFDFPLLYFRFSAAVNKNCSAPRTVSPFWHSGILIWAQCRQNCWKSMEFLGMED